MNALTPELVAHCRGVLQHHAKTFSLAGALLPKATLDRAAVVYAFCRLVDDTADEAPSQREAALGLERLSAELTGERPPRPVVAAYLAVCADTGIPVEAAQELMRGVIGDLGEVIVETDRELLRYGYRVAGTVGLMMCGVLGVRDTSAWANAIDLGVAMQITNICRDVHEDAERGRVYLPTQRLAAAFGESMDDWPAALTSPNAEQQRAVSVVVRDLLEVADQYYVSADQGMAAIPWAGRAAIVVASRVYRAIGLVLRARDHNPFRGRAVVPNLRKGWWMVRAVSWSFVVSWWRRRDHEPRLHQPLRGLPAIAE